MIARAPPPEIAFTVPGVPPVWKRQGGGRKFRWSDSRRNSTQKQSIQAYALRAIVGHRQPVYPSGPVGLRIVAYWPMKGGALRRRPRARTRKASRPDWDNVAKLISDALDGIAYTDDGQVCRAVVETWHCGQGEAPRVNVRVMQLAVSGEDAT